jgi:hypothetical protein
MNRRGGVSTTTFGKVVLLIVLLILLFQIVYNIFMGK